MRPSKVIASAFSAGFHLIAHRALPRPVGSRAHVARYRHLSAGWIQPVNATCELNRGSGGRPSLPVEVQRLFWSRIRDGEILDDAARLVGVSKSVALRWFREAGGVMPDAARLVAISTVRLSFAEREEISCRSAAGEGVHDQPRAGSGHGSAQDRVPSFGRPGTG